MRLWGYKFFEAGVDSLQSILVSRLSERHSKKITCLESRLLQRDVGFAVRTYERILPHRDTHHHLISAPSLV